MIRVISFTSQFTAPTRNSSRATRQRCGPKIAADTSSLGVASAHIETVSCWPPDPRKKAAQALPKSSGSTANARLRFTCSESAMRRSLRSLYVYGVMYSRKLLNGVTEVLVYDIISFAMLM